MPTGGNVLCFDTCVHRRQYAEATATPDCCTWRIHTLSLMVLAVSVFLDSVAVSSGVLFCTAEDGPSVASVLEGHSVVDGCISAFSQEPLGDCVTLVTSVTAAGGTSPAGSFTAP